MICLGTFWCKITSNPLKLSDTFSLLSKKKLMKTVCSKSISIFQLYGKWSLVFRRIQLQNLLASSDIYPQILFSKTPHFVALKFFEKTFLSICESADGDTLSPNHYSYLNLSSPINELLGNVALLNWVFFVSFALFKPKIHVARLTKWKKCEFSSSMSNQKNSIWSILLLINISKLFNQNWIIYGEI